MKMQVNNHKIALEKIKNYDSIVIFHHIQPDGDCLGSQFGLKTLIKDNFPNKKVYCVGDSKNNFSFLDFQMDNEKITPEIMKNSLAIIVDANYKERIENRNLLDLNFFKETLRIDHHPNEDDLDKCTRWVDSSYVAADEMIAHMAILENWKISQTAAEYLYLGINTDSGRFLFSNTSSRTFFIVSKLYETNFNADKLLKNLSKVNFKDLNYNATLLANIKTYQNIVYIKTTKEQMAKFSKNADNGVKVNLISNIENYPIWVQFLERDDNKIRVEARSNGPIVRNACVDFNGGGHQRACGCVLEDFSKIDDFLKRLQKEI
ncbi:3'-to-5' oligoribonuclease A [Mycoplasmopsis synoviae]|nr:3'-to-5' oligoribonuclease A [Mycoplasmopsis synoviae]AQU47811.1 3'-to-5' oligoribonuclease A [Mycoplasmopsis synoviae]